ncbi:flagellar export chaperone FliS [Bacillus pinisoli]|uniref:flagellar export chaperone FliS n=1 Tax=Bacillus pinisoli TaxID=2901866 RepID=UPI001FF533A5|nr:flagellar export chaperone FliS [Bacillus pinisoli]
MALTNPYQSYQQNAVNTASPGELTLMLYNGCLKFINLARIGIEDRNIELKNTNLLKAQNIVQELMVTLNMDLAVSQQFMSMYDYINRRLIDANIKNDLDAIKEVEGYLIEFRDTWKQVIQINRQKQYTGTGRV